MQIDIRWEGIGELNELIAELPKAARERIVRPAMRAAARYMAIQTKAATPRGPTGNLQRAGGYVRQSRDPGPYGVMYRVGYRSNLGPHALIVDKGTRDRWTGKAHPISRQRAERGRRYRKMGRAYRGKMPARQFFDRAVQASSEGAILLMRHLMAQNLAREAARFRAGHLTARGTIRPEFRAPARSSGRSR